MPDQDTLEHVNPRSHNDGTQQQREPIQREGAKITDERTVELLARMVEGDIIPRLMLAHRTNSNPNFGQSSDKAIGPSAMAELAQLLLAHEVDDLESVFQTYLSAGMSIDEIYVDLMAPVACHLGEMWENDTASFADVTIGLGRMQTLLNRLSDSVRNEDAVRDDLATGLFVTPPGEMHSFGIRMVDELFRRAGWRTLCEPNARLEDVLAMVARESFHILGIGISTEAQVAFAKELIRQVRKVSRNRQILVLVGGSYSLEHPELVTSVGADFCARDGREAIAIAETVLYEQSIRQ